MSGQTSEVIHCPNCNEDVPKTLYCLNCGYPLYKLEQQKKTEPEETIILEPKHEEDVDMSVEIEQPELSPEAEVTKVDEPSIEELETTIDTELEIETTIEVEEVETLIETSITEPMEIGEGKQIIEEEVSESIEAVEIVASEEAAIEPEELFEEEIFELEEVSEITEPEEFEEIPEVELVSETEVETETQVPEESESYMINDVKIEFAPDPLTKEVMENLAKNITLKIRLIRLLRENQVKEETFKKLFDSYLEHGRLWVSRRDEIIRRLRADIERMEQELITARKDYELLEIRKSIGDASEEEYGVKAPAYKWDIGNLDKEIKNTRGGIQYVVNLKGLIPDEEIDELKSMSENDFGELDNIEGITSDTIARMKETLSESLNIIES
jgi:hypothetical protein